MAGEKVWLREAGNGRGKGFNEREKGGWKRREGWMEEKVGLREGVDGRERERQEMEEKEVG